MHPNPASAHVDVPEYGTAVVRVELGRRCIPGKGHWGLREVVFLDDLRRERNMAREGWVGWARKKVRGWIGMGVGRVGWWGTIV